MPRKSDEEFDKFVNDLQAEIDAQEEAEFTMKVLEEYRNPSNVGIIENADKEAKYRGPCGDTMHFTLILKDDIIHDMKFMTDGCGPTIACGSKLVKMVKNKKIEEALSLLPEDLSKALDGLPHDHEHCALLSVRTLNKAFGREI